MKKKKNFGLIIAITILVVIAIASILFVSQTSGKAIKAIDSKAITKETTTSTYLPENIQTFTSFNIPTKEQLDTKGINQSFKETTEIDFKAENIKALSISGDLQLLSDAGLVRVILVDSEKHEYLVYEMDNFLTSNSKELKFENVCGETCIFDKTITPVSIKVQIEDAVLNLSNINTLPESKSFTEVKDITRYKQQILKSQNQEKINKYNSVRKEWKAAETSVSNLSYEDKKKLFAKEDGTVPEYLPNLQGFLYYKGGIFTITETANNSKIIDNASIIAEPENNSREEPILPNSWDWRNRHGKNLLTSVKNQGGVGTCWVFGTIGTYEAQINLYYNQQLNLDLSEQAYIDCATTDFPGYPGSIQTCTNSYGLRSDFCRFSIHGLPDESCDLYVQRYPGSQQYCSLNYICNNWTTRVWKNNSVAQIHTFDEQTKKLLLIKKGPLKSSIATWNHVMVLVGYQNYKSNWKTIDFCNSDGGQNHLCSDNGCISKICYQENATMSVCDNYIDSAWGGDNYAPIGELINYKCLPDPYNSERHIWTYVDRNNTNQIPSYCTNGQIIPGYLNPIIGQQECGGVGDAYKSELKEYAPNNGDTYWIFKNSWGVGWGENGYGDIIVSNNNLSVNDLVTSDPNISVDNFPQYPFTPPTDHSYWPAGFNNTINCEDLDHDGYCNWGISEEKPNTCPSTCGPERDCDDSNPNKLGFVAYNAVVDPPTPPPIPMPSQINLNCRIRGNNWNMEIIR